MKGKRLGAEAWSEIDQLIKSGEKVIEVADKYGISPKTIYNRLGSVAALDGSVLEISKLRRENKALKELVGKITFELSKEKKSFSQYFKLKRT